MRKGGLGSRLLVAAWGIPLLVSLIWVGGWGTALMVAAISLVAQYEFYRLQRALGRNPLVELGLVSGAALIALWQLSGMEAIGWTLAAVYLLTLLAALMTNRSHSDALATLGGIIYPPLLGGSLLLLRAFDDGGEQAGFYLALGLIGAIWVCDTAAYAGGRAFGKHPLMPTVSPKKTVEGFLAGIVGTALFVGGWYLGGLIRFDLALVLLFAAGVIGQLGDLIESSLKREAGVKDSGALLPGHGGMLDRFDSLFAAAPATAMYLIVRFYFGMP